MNKPSISTIIVIICILIIGLYAAGEVNYFAHKTVTEKNITSPIVMVDKVGINEKMNNQSLDLGVMIDEKSSIPTKGDVVIFGHRTLQGSPFLRLNELENGDIITLEWPGVGEVNYTVTNKTIVPATYHLNVNETGNKVLLITCDPIGSTENRLIIEGQRGNVSGIDEKIIHDNPQESNAWIISGLFLIIGLVISFVYPKESRPYILATVLIISIILFYFCFNPISSQLIYDKIIFLNGGM
ncbi:MAG: class E sortase [Methanobrevibacter sp.]|uniref:class E sortase n=1 Tax=uncultured Methanobrevibacter sp. TaxID=253161 RepID=UPI0025F6C812|nr:class E sortase [uncultured Methanobrevibacter sp.]MEE0901239.1 class E sortase [Methanobrevibacter sp.]